MNDDLKRRDFLKRSVALGFGISSVSLLKASSCEKKPNILFIMTDQQHANMMSCSGNQDVRTPAMDKLAASGIRFEKAYTPNPVCMPTRFSFQTGLMPSAIGMRQNQWDVAASDAMLENSLPMVLKKAGYECAYGGKKHFIPNMDSYLMEYGYEYIDQDERAKLAQSCIEFINRPRSKPFFLFASFINPHDICYMALNDHRRKVLGQGPIKDADSRVCEATLEKIRAEDASGYPELPENFEIPENEPEGITTDYLEVRPFRKWARENWSSEMWRLHRALYARLTEMVDEHIGTLINGLEASGKRDNTIIIFTSDHGDIDSAHRLEHKSILYEESVHVPFVMSYKNGIPAKRVDKTHFVVNGIDLLPTILDYAGAKTALKIPGKSLRPLAEGKEVPRWREFIVVESQNGRMIMDERYKYCIYESGQRTESLVDLKQDSGEMKNLAYLPDHQKIVEQLRGKLKQWCKDNNDTIGQSYFQRS